MFFPLKDLVESVLIDDDERFDKKINKNNALIKHFIVDDKLNVISEERISGIISRLEYGLNYNLEKTFSRISLLLKDHDVSVMIFLRNQSDLMYSYFVETYGWRIFNDKKNDTFKKYFNNVLGEQEFEEQRFYEYSKLINVLSHFFGYDKLCVYLFEEFLCEREKVLKKISFDIDISYDQICKHIGDKKENVKNKLGDDYLSDNIDFSRYLTFFSSAYKKYPLYVWLKKALYDKNLFFLKNTFGDLRKRFFDIFIVRKGVVHKRMKEDQKKDVRCFFEKSNIELCEIINVDISLMKKYGYF
ncbi:hypothetical protein OO006_02840 [Prosthecochloris sp. SCSIO W1101]|uniref:hypothetical protein n=1 Tax=Prosthecochloris sp. SCSIO W1101 TaxID=2992242 RepID=UPI00223E42F7|nr:hypothetical protein [Prosthecochloris sp. SCSIO W1101]UZJ41950.1 hypothetical protein OO006_02840 [Prosthecochloris sp. SCSIO W1101]